MKHRFDILCPCDSCDAAYQGVLERIRRRFLGLPIKEGRTKMKKVVKKRILKKATGITKKSLTTGTKKAAR